MASNMAVKGLPKTRGSLPLGVCTAVTIVPLSGIVNSFALVGNVSSALEARNKLLNKSSHAIVNLLFDTSFHQFLTTEGRVNS